MQLTEHRNEQTLFVRHADAASVTVVDRTFSHSVALSPTQAIERIAARSVDEIDTATVDAVLALKPELVLLGTGAKATFPKPALAAEFLKRGIGLETMDNAAAARTFNVLVGENRHAVVLFLIAA